jgi:hypothetical protein
MTVLTATWVQVMWTMKNVFYVQIPCIIQSMAIQWQMQSTCKYHEDCSLFVNTIPIPANSKRRIISIRQASPCTYCADMEDHAVTQPCSLKCWREWHWNIWTGLIWGHSQTQLPSDPFKCRVKQQKVDNNRKLTTTKNQNFTFCTKPNKQKATLVPACKWLFLQRNPQLTHV